MSTKNISLKNTTDVILGLNKNDIANKTSAGFIYQDLVLIKQLLYLEDNGTEIGYEVLDDIHILKNNFNLELIQVKSSINSDVLTESSSDFWKTICKWANIIKSSDVSNISFVFYTNRTLSSRSKLFDELEKENINITEVIKIIDDLYLKLQEKERQKESGKPVNPIYQKVKSIFELDTKNKELLFEKLIFVTSEDQVIQDIKQRLKFFGIQNDKDIDTAYNQLLGIVTDKRFELAKLNREFTIDYNYFRKDLHFNRLLNFSKIEEINFGEYYNYENKYNENFQNKIFYKQLVDIDIVSTEINNLARERAKAASFMDDLEILPSEENIINCMFIDEWKEVYDEEYEDQINDNVHHIQKAQNCLKQTKKSKIHYNSSDLPKPFIKGKFVDLSNQPKLGWRVDWKEKYCE